MVHDCPNKLINGTTQEKQKPKQEFSTEQKQKEFDSVMEGLK